MQALWFILLLIDPSSGQRSADSLQLWSRDQTLLVSTWSC